MITTEECKKHLIKCEELGKAPGLSVRRAAALLAICHAWIALGREVTLYNDIVEQEGDFVSNGHIVGKTIGQNAEPHSARSH
jgi:hypothetical protein